MPVSIRLSRIGTTHKPVYRMVIVDSRKKRDGEFLENIGTYDGLAGEFVTFKPERFEAWIGQGAQPSDTARKLYQAYKNKMKKEMKSSTISTVKSADVEKSKKTSVTPPKKTSKSKPKKSAAK